jgi:hypothetical protein
MLRLIALGILAARAQAQATASPNDLAHAIDAHRAGWRAIARTLGVKDLEVLPRCDPDTTWPCAVDVIAILKPSQVILALSGWPGIGIFALH